MCDAEFLVRDERGVFGAGLRFAYFALAVFPRRDEGLTLEYRAKRDISEGGILRQAG